VFALIPRSAVAQNSTVQPRILAPIDESALVTLPGNTHPLARPQNDRGAAADSTPIRRILLLLQRSPDQESALRTLLDDQQNSSSMSFHRWLSPAQFGQQFGPADADIQKLTGWLQSHGFQVARVSAGKTIIEFSGNAGQVREAFHTEIHRYFVDGKERLANATDPQIPAALADVVAGPVSLHNFPAPQLAHIAGTFRKNITGGTVAPLFTFSPGCGSTPCNAMGPGDFAAIYNVQKLWNPPSGPATDGTGQTIAIVGTSEICTANSPDFTSQCNGNDDVAAFRNVFGLPQKAPNVILDGPDPGFDPGGGETEGDLDVEWSGAVARNATIDFVIAEQTEASQGFDLAAEYVVDNNLAPVLSSSFGECEAALGGNANQFQYALWEQAAAQGITVTVAAGDSGSASCDNRDLSSPNAAQFGTFVSGVASTPFNVAVGGTDFDFGLSNYQSTFWSAGNTTVNGINAVSATQYIPETAWNDSCAQTFTGSLAGCTSPASSTSVNILAGGGGPSSCAVETTNTDVCYGYWPKPSWQPVATASGFSAVSDVARDIPDVSLFSAYGPITNTFYIVCEADEMRAPCSVNASSFDFLGLGGTSAAAPSFAGIMALVNQNMANLNQPARQGNANYVLYHLAANQSALNCSSSATPDSRCTFNDVTKGNNSVPCVGGSPACSDTSKNGTYGILETNGNAAFNAGMGFDLATGLGSVNAFNLVNNWPAAVGAFTPTSTTLCLSTTAGTCVPGPVTLIHGQTVYVTAAVTPTSSNTPIGVTWSNTKPELISLIGTFPGQTPGCTAPNCSSSGVIRFAATYGDNAGFSVPNADALPLSAGQLTAISNNTLVGGSYLVKAHFAGDGTFGASDSAPGISVTVNPEASTAAVQVWAVNPSTGDASPASSAPYGTLDLVRASVSGTSSGQETATGTVQLSDNGGSVVGPSGAQNVTTLPLTTEGYAEDQTPFLSVGTHSLVAQYAGDPSYHASLPSTPALFTVNSAPTTTIVTASSTSVAPNTSVGLTAVVDTQSLAANPGGTVTFFANGVQIGSPVGFFLLSVSGAHFAFSTTSITI